MLCALLLSFFLWSKACIITVKNLFEELACGAFWSCGNLFWRTRNNYGSSAIAAFWSLGMAVGAIFIVLTPGYAPNLSSYLFGNILTISRADIGLTAAFATALSLFFALLYRPIVYTAFDRDFAQVQGLPVRRIESAMTLFTAITIVLSIRLVGIMLLMSLLTVPQMTVNLFTADFRRILFGSIALGFFTCVCGLWLSFVLQVPSGAFIIVVLIVIFLLAKLIHARLLRKR